MTDMDAIFSQIAAQHGVNPEEVRNEIQAAIKTAVSDPDPAIQARWNALSTGGKLPTPEDLILSLAQEVKKRTQQ